MEQKAESFVKLMSKNSIADGRKEKGNLKNVIKPLFSIIFVYNVKFIELHAVDIISTPCTYTY